MPGIILSALHGLTYLILWSKEYCYYSCFQIPCWSTVVTVPQLTFLKSPNRWEVKPVSSKIPHRHVTPPPWNSCFQTFDSKSAFLWDMVYLFIFAQLCHVTAQISCSTWSRGKSEPNPWFKHNEKHNYYAGFNVLCLGMVLYKLRKLPSGYHNCWRFIPC